MTNTTFCATFTAEVKPVRENAVRVILCAVLCFISGTIYADPSQTLDTLRRAVPTDTHEFDGSIVWCETKKSALEFVQKPVADVQAFVTTHRWARKHKLAEAGPCHILGETSEVLLENDVVVFDEGTTTERSVQLGYKYLLGRNGGLYLSDPMFLVLFSF